MPIFVDMNSGKFLIVLFVSSGLYVLWKIGIVG